MSEQEVLLTVEGKEELEKKLEYLKTQKRYEISEQIKEARAFGDISENAEYDEAKNEQARIEGEILQIENKLRHAKVVKDDEISTDVISVGTNVTVLDVELKEKMELSIVGSTEADPYKGKMSNESPVGKALIGRKKGETIKVETPAGDIKFKILAISK